jgi:Reverse transcriptase (RNA-dependent DNA polymerase)
LNCLDKLAEKIVAERLAHFAETANLLYFNQIGDRKQKSAIDAAISLLSDIEINKHRKKLTSALFLDVKKAFDHVNKSQLLEICCNLRLPSACINWIHSFVHDRKISLAFDNENMKSPVNINAGIPQGSPVSPILFLIYISQLFKSNSNLTVRMSSYMNDIALVATSRSVHENCQLLQNAAKQLID